MRIDHWKPIIIGSFFYLRSVPRQGNIWNKPPKGNPVFLLLIYKLLWFSEYRFQARFSGFMLTFESDLISLDRFFPASKHYLHYEMDRGSKVSGVKRIRIHYIRRSHVSFLIDMGFSALAIADHMGHESIDITYPHAHLFLSKQIEMATQLNTQIMEE